MEYINLYADDENEQNMEIEETIEEENDQDCDFIDDNVSFSNKSTFHRTVDHAVDSIKNAHVEYIKNLKLMHKEKREWGGNPVEQVEKYTMRGLINPENNNFDNEEATIKKIRFCPRKELRDSVFSAIVFVVFQKSGIKTDLTDINIQQNKTTQKLLQINDN